MMKIRFAIMISLLFCLAAPPVFGAQAQAAPESATATVAAASGPGGVTGTAAKKTEPQEPAPLAMKAGFASKTVAAGDIATLNLSFTLPDKARLDDPPKISGLPEGQPAQAKKTGSGLSVSLLADTLDSFRVGPLTLEFTGRDGKRRAFRSEPAAVSVTTALASDPSKQSPAPLKEILPVGFAYKTEALTALGVILVLAVIFFLWRFFSGRKKKSGSHHSIAPHEAALFALARLEDDETLSDKQFAFRLSALLRAYMGAIRNIPAAEMTYEEIASSFLPAEDREVLFVLRATDMVKFAGHVPTARERQEQLAGVRGYITGTMPKPETGPDAHDKMEAAR